MLFYVDFSPLKQSIFFRIQINNFNPCNINMLTEDNSFNLKKKQKKLDIHNTDIYTLHHFE